MTKRLSLVILPLLLLPFQNCSFSGSTRSYVSQQKNSAGTIGAQDSGGQPYDGKPYVVIAACADGTLVQSRLVIKGDNAALGGTLYRDACQSETPRTIPAASIHVDTSGADLIEFEGRLFSGERPAIPLPGMISWNYQLQGTLVPRAPSIFIIDMFDNSAATIKDLKLAGHTVICTISAGTVENWRSDAGEFLSVEIGRRVSGANNEQWLDTRSGNVRRVMRERLDTAKSKGCQGIDFDSVDGYQNSSGFALTSASQLEYNQYLAFAAHDRGLILALNNVPELAPNLAIQFDLAIAEQCFEYGECGNYSEFVKRGKPVLAAEYAAYSAAQCTQAQSLLLSLVFLSPNLDGSRYQSCQ